MKPNTSDLDPCFYDEALWEMEQMRGEWGEAFIHGCVPGLICASLDKVAGLMSGPELECLGKDNQILPLLYSAKEVSYGKRNKVWP